MVDAMAEATVDAITGFTAIVLAKAPVAGRVKTRLCPPCTPEEAAAVALGAIEDTLAVMGSVPATRHLLVLDGAPGSWIPEIWDVVPQSEGGLDRRLGAAFAEADGPAVLVGMDTPQLDAAVVTAAGRAVAEDSSGAVLGMARDGGFWIVALPDGGPHDFQGVPMSADDTGARQIERLSERGRRVELVTELTDVDHWDEAKQVAAVAPFGRFAAVVERVTARLG